MGRDQLSRQELQCYFEREEKPLEVERRGLCDYVLR